MTLLARDMIHLPVVSPTAQNAWRLFTRGVPWSHAPSAKWIERLGDTRDSRYERFLRLYESPFSTTRSGNSRLPGIFVLTLKRAL